MSAATVDRDNIVVVHPDWCTDTSVEHREENNGVRLVNDCVGVVMLEHTCPGPMFKGMFVELHVTGTHYLPNGSWDFSVADTRRAARGGLHVGRDGFPDGEDSLTDLIDTLTAASDWINDQIAKEAHR